MQVSRLKIRNFRGIKKAKLDFEGHTLLIGTNNVGKSAVCEALDLALSPDRQRRFPVVEEYDFYNARYIDDEGEPVEIRIEVLLTDVTTTVQNASRNYLERWDSKKRCVLAQGELDKVDDDGLVWCLRLLTVARYNAEEDEFEAGTYYASQYDPENEADSRVSRPIKRNFGFLYLRALRTGSRALSLERGSLLDIILRIQSIRTGIWEEVRSRLESLDPPIDAGATQLAPVLQTIEQRLAEYVTISTPGDSTRIFVSQLTREHLRKTLSFFISVTEDQKPVPFQDVGTGTLNALVLALLSFVAELKEDNVIFAMEEPEIALPPHTQRRITRYLLTNTTQCFVTSHSPYVIEAFEPERVAILRRSKKGKLKGRKVSLSADVKPKTYQRHLRRTLAEAMLGRGVIVVEGFTEQPVFHVVCEIMEAADASRHPLDLSGVTVVTTGGDGSLAEFGRFFASLDLPTFAFYDDKARSKKEQEALAEAGFILQEEIQYAGMESLLAAELSVDIQWDFLKHVRDTGLAPKTAIPADQPTGSSVRELTEEVLKGGKGAGRAAELVSLCSPEELPGTIVDFLDQVYAHFPPPKSLGVGGPEDGEDAGEEIDAKVDGKPQDSKSDGL